MHPVWAGLALIVLVGCGGGDVPSDSTALAARENLASRDAAQEGRVLNPEALACLKNNATEEEWRVLGAETEASAAVLQQLLGREGTARCFAENNVVIYL